MNKKASIGKPVILLLLCFLFSFAFCESIPKKGVINDEAVELLQSQDLPTDRFYYFAPNYHGGQVDLIESLVPYVNLLNRRLFGPDLIFIHLFYALCYCAACYLFFLLVKVTSKSENFALFGAILFGGSSYASFYNRILTRNGISLLWTSAILWMVWRVLHESGERKKKLLYCVYMPIVLILSILTYTSFKFIAAAVYLSLGVWLVFSSKRSTLKRQEGMYIFFSVCITLLLLLFLVVLSKIPVHSAIFRGGYVLGGSFGFAFKKYASHLFRSFLLPVFFKPGGDFLIEVTHTAYNRHTLSVFMVPFFVLGLWNTLRTWKEGFKFQQFVLVFWIWGVVLLAVGGPHLKHHFALFPLVVLIGLYGLKPLSDWRAFVFHKRWIQLSTLAFLIVYFGGEIRHMFWIVPRDSLLVLDSGLPRAVAQKALRNTETLAKVYIIEGWGRDAVRYYTRQNSKIRYAGNHDDIETEMKSDIEHNQPFEIIIDGKSPPKFFATHDLHRCFEKTTYPEGQWAVTTYIMTKPCK